MTPVFISSCGFKLKHFYRQTSMGIDIEYKQPFLALVDQILAAKQQQPSLSTFDKGDFDANANTSALERQIDQMVYKLYDLTPEEIAIVEGRSNNGNKTRQVANKQLKAIEALPGAILREVFDFEEDREG